MRVSTFALLAVLGLLGLLGSAASAPVPAAVAGGVHVQDDHDATDIQFHAAASPDAETLAFDVRRVLLDRAADGAVLDEKVTVVHVAVRVANARIAVGDQVIDAAAAALPEGVRLQIAARTFEVTPDGAVAAVQTVPVAIQVGIQFSTEQVADADTGALATVRHLLVAVNVLEVEGTRVVHVGLRQLAIVVDENGNEVSRGIVQVAVDEAPHDQPESGIITPDDHHAHGDDSAPADDNDDDDSAPMTDLTPASNSTSNRTACACAGLTRLRRYWCWFKHAPLVQKIFVGSGVVATGLVVLICLARGLCHCCRACKTRCEERCKAGCAKKRAAAAGSNYHKNILAAHAAVQYTLLPTYDTDLKK